MKILYPLLVFLLIGLCKTSSAQLNFAPVGAEWHYSINPWIFGGASYARYYSAKDTIVQGKNCRQLIRNGWGFCDGEAKWEYVYETDSAVYFWSWITNDFRLLFDLKKEVGEKWMFVRQTDMPGIDTFEVRVDSISSTLINGNALKTLNVSLWSYYNGTFIYRDKGTIIDRIGDIAKLFDYSSSYVCDGSYTYGLRCYSDTTIGFYSTHIAPSCDFVGVGINEIPQPLTQTYPNPTTGLLEILPPDNNTQQIQLSNPTGQLLLSKTIQSKSQLDLSALPAGLYLLTITGSNNSRSVMKVVKQ